MREAEAMGLRPEGSNPCRGIRRNRRKGRERFLSDDEIRRLSARLAAYAGRYPEQVAIVRLLLLTGCRKGEILTLRRSDYREGHLFLRDSKTGPGPVWLSRPARDILDAIERKGRSVFTPHARDCIPETAACNPSGSGSGRRRVSATRGFTISGIRMRAMPCGGARPCSRSAGCSATPIPRPP